jgi:PAS domain S-box-containing protein
MSAPMAPEDPRFALEAARLAAVLDTAADGIITIDEAGIVTSFNRAAETMFLYSAAEVVGQNVAVLMPSPDREQHDGYLRRYLETGEAQIIGKGREVTGRRKDGTEFPALLAVSEGTPEGGPRFFTGILRDITDLREARESIRRERDFVENLVETAQDIVLMLDPEGRIVRFNSYLEALCGWSLEEVKGQPWVETFLPEAEQRRVREVFKKTRGGGDTSGTVNSILTRDGRELRVRWSNTTVRDEAGNPTAVLAIGHDITELSEAQARLVQSERLAAIGEMVSGLAHESRNALQRIQACLEMLELQVEGNADALDLVSRIQRAQDQLAKLYDDVRAYARPMALQCQSCELDRLWRATWADLELERSGRATELIEQIDADTTCEADPYAVQQVFRNVFENALSACGDGCRVTIRAEDAGQRLAISVEDDGPGLQAEQARRIFTPFFTTKTKGSGLGMPIVKRIIEAHGGAVEAGNGAGGGACVTIWLPRKQ